MRLRPLLLALVLTLPGLAWAQGSALTVEVQAGRVQAFSDAGETVVVYQADGKSDLRIRGSRVANGQEQTFDIRAEEAVVFLDGRPQRGERPRRVPIRGLYAVGWVRVEVNSPTTGLVVAECEETYLDFLDERAALREVRLRMLPAAGVRRKGILGSSLYVRARQLHARGMGDLVGEDAQVSVCDHGEPHFALAGDRLRARGPRPEPIPDAAAGVGGLGGMLAAEALRPRLLSALDLGQKKKPNAGRRKGSDALSRFAQQGQTLELSGLSLVMKGQRLPVLPFAQWNTSWPIPTVRVGSSSRFGIFAFIGAEIDLDRFESDDGAALTLSVKSRVEHYQRRGTGGGGEVAWVHEDREGRTRGRGFFAADGLRDRADEDRVGTAIRNEGRYWLRGLVSQDLLPTIEGRDVETPLYLKLDAELSRISDPGYLLEYSRGVAQTDKDQETYAYLRGTRDEVAARIITRHRLNDFQDQVEYLPEARLDWIKTPIATDPLWGGLYFDAALRAGHVRRRPADGGGPSYRAGRGDFDVALDYKNSFGPVVFRGWGGARYTSWSERPNSESSIERWATRAGWNLSMPLWRRYDTSLGTLRHEILPEVGMRHVTDVTRDPAQLLQFDEVEQVRPGDEVFLRLRSRLLTDIDRKRSKVLDLAVETRYQLMDQRFDLGRFTTITYDLRVRLGRWFGVRARVDQDILRGRLLDLNLQVRVQPLDGLVATATYLDFIDVGRSLTWSVEWRITEAWGITGTQQYDLDEEEFLRHSGKLVRYFHRFALEMTLTHDPQQDDTSFSINVLALFSPSDDPLQASRADTGAFQ